MKVKEGKTREMAQILNNINSKKVLLLDTMPMDDYLQRSSRSLNDRFKFMDITKDRVNAYHILDNSLLLMTKRAIQHYEDRLTWRLL